jgi:hypothetical protein
LGFAILFPLIVQRDERGLRTTLPVVFSIKQCSLLVSGPPITGRQKYRNKESYFIYCKKLDHCSLDDEIKANANETLQQSSLLY